MKSITFSEWSERFEIKDLEAADTSDDILDDPDRFTFYDNGAVRCESTFNYVIKADQVKPL